MHSQLWVAEQSALVASQTGGAWRGWARRGKAVAAVPGARGALLPAPPHADACGGDRAESARGTAGLWTGSVHRALLTSGRAGKLEGERASPVCEDVVERRAFCAAPAARARSSMYFRTLHRASPADPH